jgi:hypothetical protein
MVLILVFALMGVALAAAGPLQAAGMKVMFSNLDGNRDGSVQNRSLLPLSLTHSHLPHALTVSHTHYISHIRTITPIEVQQYLYKMDHMSPPYENEMPSLKLISHHM